MRVDLPQLVRLGREVCADLDQAERHEWWLTNGKGGYAGGTVAGTLTRRYNGLLIAPTQSNLQRQLLFAKADAELLDGDRVLPLYTNRWGSGAIEPQGNLVLESFALEGRMPVWRYRVDDLLIEARIWMEHGRHCTVLAWCLLENPVGREVRLRVRLMTNVRDHHGVTGFDRPFPVSHISDCELDVHYPDSPVLHFHSRCGSVEAANFWVEDFDLPAEHERGLPDRDRHQCVGLMTFPVCLGHWVGLTASIEQDEPPCYLEESMRRFLAHDCDMLTRTKVTVSAFTQVPAWVDQLLLAADSFVIRQQDGSGRHAIVAGYPWFGEWGRDSMIALPGLLLATGRYTQARELLLGYLPLMDRGMLPNWFPGDGETPQYNTADAALWYIEALCAYLTAVKDVQSVVQAWPVLQQIVAHYRDGTRHGIGMDTGDGLLRAGEAGVQLTWMDAKVGDHVVTPRIGKPVEINALWFNALQTMAEFALVLKDEVHAHEYAALADRARAGFQRYVRPDGMGLLDVLDGPDGDDARIRPNQIFAVSLPFSPLNYAAQRAVVQVCEQHLLTPFGLRSLAPGEADYRPHYQGDVWARDTAYHQGTVWAWLLGHYALAEYRVSGDSALALSRLAPMASQLVEDGLGTLGEIFDAEAPHRARGAPSQAWSVACTLEAWWKLYRAQHATKSEDSHDQHS